MHKPNSRWALYLFCLLALAELAGCTARPESMVPETEQRLVSAEGSRLYRAVALTEVGGGERTRGGVDISSEAFRKALHQALEAHRFLSPDPTHAPYRLKAFLIELRDPRSSYTMTADSFVRYTLTQTADGKVLFDEIIRGSDTKTVADDFWGVERMRLANEGAMRMSIVHLLRRLALY